MVSQVSPRDRVVLAAIELVEAELTLDDAEQTADLTAATRGVHDDAMQAALAMAHAESRRAHAEAERAGAWATLVEAVADVRRGDG